MLDRKRSRNPLGVKSNKQEKYKTLQLHESPSDNKQNLKLPAILTQKFCEFVLQWIGIICFVEMACFKMLGLYVQMNENVCYQ